MRTRILWAGLLASLWLTGCDKLADKLVEQTSNVEAQAAQAEPEVDKDAQLADKLSHYITCLNDASSNVFRSKKYYLSWMDDVETGPSGKEHHANGPQEIHQADRCYEELKEAKAKAPALPEIEAAGAAYQSALEKLTPVIKTANDYYSQKDYKDDKFKKGKEIHPKLMGAFDDFKKAHETFEKKVVTLNEEVGQRQLAKMAKDPLRTLEHKTRIVVNASKPLIKHAEIQTLEELKAAEFDAKIEAFSKAVDELEAYVAKNKDQTDKVSGYSSFVGRAKELLVSVKELSRRKRDNKDFNKEPGSPEHTNGHPAEVIRTYNELINTSNRLDFNRLYQALAEASQTAQVQ